MVWCSFHAQWKWCFLNWLVNSTDSGFSAVHLQEENDMTSKRRKLQFMLLPVNLAATYNTWLSNFVVNYKYEKFWDDHRFLSFSFYIKIGSLCLNDFLRFSGLPDKKTLFLKERTCIISKEFAPKITKHSKIIVWAILRTIYLTSIDCFPSICLRTVLERKQDIYAGRVPPPPVHFFWLRRVDSKVKRLYDCYGKLFIRWPIVLW